MTLIMDRNLGGTVEWISKTDYSKAGGTYAANRSQGYSDIGNDKGPLIALATLESRTSRWTNVPTMTYTYTDDGEATRYSPITRTNVRARLLTLTELKSLGCEASGSYTKIHASCPSYLYGNLYTTTNTSWSKGYWLSSSAREVCYGGYYYDVAMLVTSIAITHYDGITNTANYSGLRTVIVIPKKG